MRKTLPPPALGSAGEHAAVLGGDVQCDGQAQPGAILLGGEEWIEDALPVLCRDAGAPIADIDADTVFGKRACGLTTVPSPSVAWMALRMRFSSNCLICSGSHSISRGCPSESNCERHALPGGGVLGQRRYRLNHLQRFRPLQAGQARTSEIEKVREQLVQPLRLFGENLQALGCGLRQRLVLGPECRPLR